MDQEGKIICIAQHGAAKNHGECLQSCKVEYEPEGRGGGELKGRAIVKASQEESLRHSFRRLAVNEYNLDS